MDVRISWRASHSLKRSNLSKCTLIFSFPVIPLLKLIVVSVWSQLTFFWRLKWTGIEQFRLHSLPSAAQYRGYTRLCLPLISVALQAPAFLPFMFFAHFTPCAFWFCPCRQEFIPLCLSSVICPHFTFSGGFLSFLQPSESWPQPGECLGPFAAVVPSELLCSVTASSAVAPCARNTLLGPRRCFPDCTEICSFPLRYCYSVISFLPFCRITNSIILYWFMVIITRSTFCLQFLQ